MSSCIVDVQFLFNEDNCAFPKKILISGIRNKSTFTKEIDYKLPTFTEPLCENLAHSKATRYDFGIINFETKNDELRHVLKSFDTIVTKNRIQRNFIRQFTMERTKVFKLEE